MTNGMLMLTFVRGPGRGQVRNEGAEEGRRGCVQKTFVFYVPNTQDLLNLLTYYCPPRLLRTPPPYLYQGEWAQMKEADAHQLCEDIEDCRKTLGSCPQLLQPPAPDSSVGFLLNSFRRLAKPRIDKQTPEGENGADAEERKLGQDYWTCSKTALRQSLSVLQDSRIEETAIHMFSSILLYCDVDNSGPSESGQRTLLQSLSQKSLDNDRLSDEYYLQLIKQTTGQSDDTLSPS
ncbi:hypothetical protein ACOMHN_009149 [Nucella lapillus]